MRAVVLPEFGSAPALIDIDTPVPVEGEVRVRVRAAAVDAVGPGVRGYAVGDRVFGVVTKSFLGDGSFGEFVTVPVSVGLAKLPESVNVAEGAALGLAGTTANDVVAAAELSAGSTILVVGATGGVGSQVIQLAAAAGAHVTSLGAGESLNYREDLAAGVLARHPEGVDVVVHLAGTSRPSCRCCAREAAWCHP